MDYILKFPFFYYISVWNKSCSSLKTGLLKLYYSFPVSPFSDVENSWFYLFMIFLCVLNYYFFMFYNLNRICIYFWIVKHFINFILKRTEGGATVDFIMFTKLFFSKSSAFGDHTLGWFLGISPRRLSYHKKKLFPVKFHNAIYTHSSVSTFKIDKVFHNLSVLKQLMRALFPFFGYFSRWFKRRKIYIGTR